MTMGDTQPTETRQGYMPVEKGWQPVATATPEPPAPPPTGPGASSAATKT